MDNSNYLSDSDAWNTILEIEYKIHKVYGQPYLDPEQVALFEKCISSLRENRNTPLYQIIALKIIVRQANKHRIELKNILRNQPRRDAQKFIGNKKVREEIFNRDGWECLRCGAKEKLSIDHIVPVNYNGENKISNLQTLCSSCNSWKSDKIIDFRK